MPGGSGVCQAVFEHAGWGLVRAALEIVSGCDCDVGCPTCVVFVTCKEHNEVINKRAAELILQAICGYLPDAVFEDPAPERAAPDDLDRPTGWLPDSWHSFHKSALEAEASSKEEDQRLGVLVAPPEAEAGS